MFNADPSVQRSLGHGVDGLDGTKWDTEKRGFMKDILMAKFTQDEESRRILLLTSDKLLCEANGRDNYFGTGIPLTHPEVLNPDKWAEHGNHLGQILMEIRQVLKQ